MIGQLQKNFIKFVSAGAILASFSTGQAFAETVSGRLIYADWFVLVKDEAGVQTVMARGERWPAGPRPVMVQFDINENAQGDNNLYIIAGSIPGDGQEPFLAASLIGSKTLKTGDSSIEAFQSDYTELNAPTNPIMIKEIIKGNMGGGTFTPSAPVIYGAPTKSLGTSTVPAIWFEGQQDNGRAVVFRIPYSALFDQHTDAVSGSGGSSSGPTNLGDKEREDLLKVILEEQAQTRFQTNRANSLEGHLKTRDREIVSLNTEVEALKFKIETFENGTPFSKLLLWTAMGIGLGGLIGFLLGRRRNNAMLPKGQKLQLQQSPSESQRIKPSFPVHVLEPEGDKFLPVSKQYPEDMRNYDADKGKLIVEAVMGAVVSGSSKLIATKGQIASAIPAVRKAYHAVGRVGEAQDGVAIGRDKSLGTAILIDENRIMTNRHVFDWNYERIDDPGDPVGVEFFGEKDSDASEFYELTTKDVVIIEEYDAVILTLAKSVPASKRKPIKFATHSPEHFDESEVYVIGYPAKPAPMTPEIEEAMDGDLVFGVKRFSEGKIYRHPQDTNLEYGIETHTSGNYSEQGWLLAICHQASTLPGNSGSAIISQATGELVGIHFGSDKFDRTLPSHPANVAHSGVFLSNSVTFITSNAFKNYLTKDI